MIPLGILASAHVTASASYAAEVLADSPLWYFPLGESSTPAVDAVSSTNGTTTGSVTFAASGLGDRATSVDFAGGNIQHSRPAFVGGASSDSFSIEALCAPDAVGGGVTRMIMNRENNGLSNRDYRLWIHPSTSKFTFSLSNGAEIQSTTTPSTGTSYHVAATFDLSGGTLKLYVNGVLETTASGGARFDPGWPHCIGANPGAGNYPFDGKIAGVAMYASVLSGTRIAAHSVASGH